MTQNKKSYYTLSLKQIASWQIPTLRDDLDSCSSKINAEVPPLQRGLVWEPQQIEMFWDSLMRGFPVGSIVISETIKNQKINNSENITHHLLDGQQRMGAIVWGFVDPWNKGSSQKDHEEAVLWIDLLPGNKIEKNTRKYLFRLTTKAHPWGFRHDESAGRLEAKHIRKFLEIHCIKGEEYRPLPGESFPFDANLAFPISILYSHYLINNGKIIWENIFSEFETKFQANLENCEWRSNRDKFLNDRNAQESIVTGLKTLKETQIMALQVPSDIKGIEDYEQVFQRLNRQGTPLDNEELAFSMIKAYWPEVKDVINGLTPRVITDARLVGLAVRIALTLPDAEKIAPERSIEQIRGIFKNPSSDDQTKIKAYIEEGQLQDSLKWIEDIFIYDEKNNAFGVPRYLRSSIAWSSREVFAWLMYLARKFNYKSKIDESLRKKIIGIALIIHWFGTDKAKAIDYLIKIMKEGEPSTKLNSIRIAEIKGDKKPFILNPLCIDNINNAIPEIKNTNTLEKINALLKNSNSWNFWNLVVVHEYSANGGINKRESEDQEKRKMDFGFFFDKIIRNNELLVYKQRHYIEDKFKDFDPSNKIMWKGHNRPWDYDHILPSNDLNAQGSGLKTYTEACQMWQRSIGNLIAVDFTFNRSAQDVVTASEKYKGKDNILKGSIDDSFIDYFAIKLEDTDKADCSLNFMNSARDRFLNIYKDWLDALDIHNLIQ